MTDTLTLAILLFPWALWLGWEIYLLVRRGQGVRVATISMVARDRAVHLCSVIYAWGGMAAHWWWPGANHATVAGSVVFWIALVGFLIQDIVLWRTQAQWWPLWLQWQRKPILILALGFIAGKFLFPQKG